MQKDTDKVKTDEKTEAVKHLQEAADKIREEDYEGRPDVKDVVKDIIFFFISVVFAFGWMMLMQLIISFVSLGYIHMDIDRMMIVSIICGIIFGIYYLYKMVVKYRKK